MDTTVEIYELHNYRFSMNMRGGYMGDLWMLGGQVYGKPGFEDGGQIFVSVPQSLDGDIMTTYSGSHYRLVNAGGDEDEIKDEINEVIKQGKYSRH